MSSLLDTSKTGMMGGASGPKTLILLHMNGSNGGTSFPDDVVGNTWVANGAAVTSTAQAKFGTASLATLSGTSDITSSNNIVLPAGDFTFEFWYYANVSILTTGAGIAMTTTGDNFDAYFQGNTQLFLYLNNFGNGIYAPGIATVSNGAWHHYAFQLQGTTGTVFIDGVAQSTTTDSGFPLGFNNQLRIGRQNNTPRENCKGYIDEVRLSNVARYISGNFTPSAVPFVLD